MCKKKTMLKIGGIIAALLVVGAIAFPQFRPILISLAPFALLAICPISMIFCMKGMNKDKDGKTGDDCDSKIQSQEKAQNQIEPHAH